MQKFSRRDFLGLTAAALLSGCQNIGRGSANELHVYSWADYIAPNVIPEFQRRYGIKVVYDTFASNEALLAKLQAGAKNYDIIVPSGYMVRQLKKLELLSRIDHNRLSNFSNLHPRFKDSLYDSGCAYSVPYTWGTTGIGFNASAFGRNSNSWPKNWDVFWDKALAHRMTLLDDARETIGMALKRNEKSYNTIDELILKNACADLIVQKPLTMCYTSDQVVVQLASGDSLLSLGYSGDVYQSMKDNADVRYVIPSTGASLWTDNLCIPAFSPNIQNAYLWINFMLEPEIAAAIANYTRYATPNEKALKHIDSAFLEDKNLYLPQALMERCEEIGDVGKAIFTYDRLWTELKCV